MQQSSQEISLYSAGSNNYQNYDLFGAQSNHHYRAMINHITQRLHLEWSSIPFSEIPMDIRAIITKQAPYSPEIVVFYHPKDQDEKSGKVITGYALQKQK